MTQQTNTQDNPRRVKTWLVGDKKPMRVGFVSIHKPKVQKQKDGRETSSYEFTLLIPKDREDMILAFRKAAKEALVQKFGSDKAKWPARLRNTDLKTYLSPGKDGWPIRDGDMQGYEGFENCVSIHCKSVDPIPVFDSNRKPMQGDQLRSVVSGLICHAVVTASGFDNPENKGCSFWANTLVVMRDDGTRFGGGINMLTVLDDLPEDEEEDPSNYQAPTGSDEF